MQVHLAISSSGSGIGDEALFEATYRRHYQRVWRVAARLAPGDAEAEELTQETFLRLHGAPVLRRSDAEIVAWLIRVVTNLALNATRGRQREIARLERVKRLETPSPSVHAEATDPAHVVERAEERRLVREVLERLPPRARACLVLRHSGLSYTEIAETLGIAPGSVGTTLARAERAFAAEWERRTNGM